MVRKGIGGKTMLGLQKVGKNDKPVVQQKQQKASQQKPAKAQFSVKDPASFLKNRMNKKVRDLKFNQAAADEDDMEDAPMAADSGSAVPVSIEAMQAEASKRGDDFERDNAEEGGDEIEEAAWGNWDREAENNRKKFYTEFRKVLGQADIIIEVLDARDPESCRCEQAEKEILRAGKKLILLLNKIDLVPKDAVEAWQKHLQRSFPTIAFKAAQGAQRPKHANTSAANAPEGLLRSTHTVVGADEVMQLLKNYARSGGTKMKTHVTVGIVGYPNTGKSSVINSMKRQHSVEAGGKAGVTKIMQEIKLDSKITLLDSPGVVFEGTSDDPSVVLRNVVKVESVQDPQGVVEALLKKAPREAVLQFYDLLDFRTVDDFLIHVAKARGKFKRGAGLHLADAARSVISDWTTGKFRYYSLPPAVSSAENMAAIEAETAQVVTNMAPALDIDALLAGGDKGDKVAVLGAPDEDGDADMGDGDEDGGERPVHADMAAMGF
eukprot:TRINITY_DN74627_c0_g1_i1.p1 TRINITY_DN74627_c0_g1~~TRINITY_DN74627_c0_g1_i1.p1  ORF type:complete len:523 (+),score=167.98 TRINITY_DN74627_c0_g1_i1:91-1569(+)